MGIYRGPGGTGDAVNDASSEATLVKSLVEDATAQAVLASTAATAAQSAETQANISKGLASDSATAAATSASNALTSENNAEAAQTAAEISKVAAELAQTNAETAETNAETSATLSEAWATQLSTPVSGSSYSAKYNANLAASSASDASTSASNAASSASAASTSASNAASSASAASTSATNAAASYDAFDDRYLGSKSSNPTVDNDGNALITGALYFNTTVPEMRVYDGSSWVFVGASGSAGVSSFNARYGDITLTSSDVTTALTYTPLAPSAIGTTVQAYDAQLADIAGLTPTDNNFIVGNGTNFVAESGATARTSLGLGTAATTDATAYATAAQGTNADTAYADRLKWDGGSTGLVAATGRTSLGVTATGSDTTYAYRANNLSDLASASTARTNLGATTIGSNVFTLTNPSAITFPRFNADNTVSALDAATFRTAIGAGTSSTTGTVTTVSVVSANGFVGTVDTATSTPAITISTSITGIIKGNGTAISAATAGTDYVAPGTATTFTALQTFTGSSSVAALKTSNIKEVATVSATAATGTIAYDITTQSVLYYTTNASGNWTLNFRGSSGTSLDTIMSTGESMSATFMVTQGATAYYNSAVQVDGNSVTPKWQGGTAPTAGNVSGIDIYTYVIIKTGSATFTVLASQTQFK